MFKSNIRTVNWPVDPNCPLFRPVVNRDPKSRPLASESFFLEIRHERSHGACKVVKMYQMHTVRIMIWFDASFCWSEFAEGRHYIWTSRPFDRFSDEKLVVKYCDNGISERLLLVLHLIDFFSCLDIFLLKYSGCTVYPCSATNVLGYWIVNITARNHSRSPISFCAFCSFGFQPFILWVLVLRSAAARPTRGAQRHHGPVEMQTASDSTHQCGKLEKRQRCVLTALEAPRCQDIDLLN